MPRQFAILGDRLAFSWGIAVLAGFACLLIWLFDASVPALIPLYSIGIFLSFAISQAGMVRHWYEERGGGWRWKLGLNLVGAIVTGLVFVISAASKIPQRGLDRPRHRPGPGRPDALGPRPVPQPGGRARWSSPTPSSPVRTASSAWSCRSTASTGPWSRRSTSGRTLGDDIRAVYVTADPDAGDALRERWDRQLPDVPFVVVDPRTAR